MKILAWPLAVLASAVGALIFIVIAAVMALQAGMFNAWIEATIAEQTGHPTTLEAAPSLGFRDGALTFDLGPLRVQNADWAKERHPDFATVNRIHAGLRIMPSLDGRIVLSDIEVNELELHLARSASGEANWPAEGQDSTGEGGEGGAVPLPDIENLQIKSSHVTYVDLESGSEIDLRIDEAEGVLRGEEDAQLSASGTFQDTPLQIDATSGPLAPLLTAARADDPISVEAKLGESMLNGRVAAFGSLDDLEGNVSLDAEAGFMEMLSSLGIAAPDVPSFTADLQIRPDGGESRMAGTLSMEGHQAELAGTVGDLARPLENLAADIRAEGVDFADLLGLGGVVVDGELPSYEISGKISADGGTYQVTALDAALGDNRVTGDVSIRDLEKLDGLDASLRLDAPDLADLLATFDVANADQLTTAVLDADITHADERTQVLIEGDVSGDKLDVEGGYDGTLTAFADPKLDLLLEGSALGGLPHLFGITTRPVESYRIEAMIEEHTDEASPVVLDALLEDTRLQFDGSIDDLRAFRGIDGDALIEGPNPAVILELFELPAINLPPYRLGGRLTWRGDDINVAGLDGVVGDSDARGDIAVDLRPEPVAVTAELSSDRLDLDDLAGLIGAAPSTDEGETASAAQAQQAERRDEQDKLLPTLAIDPSNWENLDLDLRYQADRIDSENLPIDRIRINVATDGRWLTLDPLETGLADGEIVAFASLDGTQEPLAGDFDVRVKNLQLQDFLAKLGAGGEGLGEISGRIRLTGQGRSLDELLGTADGSVGLTMSGGKLDSLVIEGIGLDIAEGLAVLMDASDQANEDKVPIRCAVANLELEKGRAQANPIVLDTPDSKITAQGTIDLTNETLDMFLESHPKDSSLLSANQPIRVDGKLLSPSVGPAPGKTDNKALGWILAPIAALLPFFDPGGEPDSLCGRLIAEAKESANDNPEEGDGEASSEEGD